MSQGVSKKVKFYVDSRILDDLIKRFNQRARRVIVYVESTEKAGYPGLYAGVILKVAHVDIAHRFVNELKRLHRPGVRVKITNFRINSREFNQLLPLKTLMWSVERIFADEKEKEVVQFTARVANKGVAEKISERFGGMHEWL